MAIRQVIESDISGKGNAETVTFSIGDRFFEVDLTEDEKAAFQKTLQTYIELGREAEPQQLVGTHPTPRPGTTVMPDTTAKERKKIRAWAQANGHEVAPKGKIPTDLIQMYDDAHGIVRGYREMESRPKLAVVEDKD